MSTVLKQLSSGILSYGTAVLLLFRSNMWMALVVPLFLKLGLLWGGEFLALQLERANFAAITDDNAAQYLFLGVQSILVYLTIYMNKYMVLALLSPVLTALSTQTEFLLTGNRYNYTFKQYLLDIQRALQISFRNMGILMVWMAGIYLLTWLFGLPGIVNDIAYYSVAFYFYGFSFMDYVSERRRLNIDESVTFTRKHFVASYALGAVYGLLFFLPWVGVVIAPILGTIAGTIAVHDMIDLRSNPYAIKADGSATETSETGTKEVQVEEQTVVLDMPDPETGPEKA